MTTPEIELTRVLETYAGDVQAHADLVELVESRFQRRRRRRMRAAAVAAGMVVLLVVAGTAVAWPRAASRPTKPPVVTPSPTATPSPSCSPIYSCATGPLPKPPAFQAGHWAAPPAKIPLATTTWPTATFQLPARAPDGFKLRPLWTIDQTHVLVSSRSHGIIVAYYSFDLTNGGFRKIGEMPGGKQATSAGSAVSDHYLYWAFSGYNSTDFAKAGFDIYVAPLAGGATRKIIHVAESSYDADRWFATDDAVYWSTRDGVETVSRTGGPVSTVAGLDGYRLVNGSTWAVRTTDVRITAALKNVVTGETRTPVAPDHDLMALNCTPAFCVGWYGRDGNPGIGGAFFIQDLDGGHRMALPKSLQAGIVTVQTVGDRGLVIDSQELKLEFWDPFAGAAGRMVATWGPDHSTSINVDNEGDVAHAEDGKAGTITYLAIGATQ